MSSTAPNPKNDSDYEEYTEEASGTTQRRDPSQVLGMKAPYDRLVEKIYFISVQNGVELIGIETRVGKQSEVE